MKNSDLYIIIPFIICCTVVVLFFQIMPLIINEEPKRPTYQEYLIDSRGLIFQNKVDKIYLLSIENFSDKGGLTIAYNGCIYYHKKFVGCDKKIAESIYNWIPTVNK